MEWALSHRLEKTMRGNHTNNYAGAGMRIIKDCFGRIKAYNRIQMFQFITVTMENTSLTDYWTWPIADTALELHFGIRHSTVYRKHLQI